MLASAGIFIYLPQRRVMIKSNEEFVLGEPLYYALSLPKELKRLKLLPISDVHYKNHLFSNTHFTRALNMLEDPETYAVLNGDLLEAVIKTSKGEIYEKLSPQQEAKWITDRLMPYKGKLLGMTMGNHEYRIFNSVGHDYCKDMAKALGIPYRPEGLLLKISFGDNNNRTKGKPYTYFIYTTHGYGGARTKSGKAVKVERVATYIDADVYIMSHDHVVNVAPDVYLNPDPRTHAEKDKDGNHTGFMIGSVKAKRKMLIKAGAFLKWGGYSEMGGFPPVDLEMPVITFAGTGKPEVRVLV